MTVFSRAVVPTKTQTVYLWNAIVKCYRYGSLFRVFELEAFFPTATATGNGDEEAECEGADWSHVAQDRD
jgi:hypothetical protein